MQPAAKAIACLGALFALAGGAVAQQAVKVEVRVTTITGGSVYLDKGRAAGLEPGDRVTFFPAAGSRSEGSLRSVSKNSARANLDPGTAPLQVGDRGEVVIPRERLEKPAGTPPKPADPAPVPDAPQPAPKIGSEHPAAPTAPTTVPDHPPWQQPPEQWSKDKPLLAPAFGLAPEERESRLHGRAYVQASGTWDDANTRRRYMDANVGVDATLDNPFGDGGSLRFDSTLWTRTADADADDVHTDETQLRVNRLTYEVGGTEDRPTRWQFGRFLQYGFPELGVLDGLEWGRRLTNGSIVGASAGAMPEPYSEMSTFDDLQAALFFRHAFDEKSRNTLGLAYQNTWHRGQQDRNLLVAEGSLAPSDTVRLRSTAWVDFYGSEDVIKDSAVELTELILSGTWRTTSRSGVGLSYSHRRTPELLRSEFHDFDAEQVSRSELDRIALNGWFQATERIRVDGRVDGWSDQDDSGSTVELGTALRNLLYSEGEVRAAVFQADGTFSSGPGFRVQASKGFGRAYANLGYEFIDYEQKDFSGEQSKLSQQALFGSLDFPLSERLDLSLLGERRFGDEQDAYTLGFLLQWRF